MILVLEDNITQAQKDSIHSRLSDKGCIIREIMDAGRNVIGVIGRPGISIKEFKKRDGVADAVAIKSAPWLVQPSPPGLGVHVLCRS